ncbi:MAG TPA: ATP-dependent DNA helicase RecG [Candidatus Gracilibacteria bacterium]|nr:ATP-dependent DNA helicase RecG [Candidatus Gracilibacteria bacterium]
MEIELNTPLNQAIKTTKSHLLALAKMGLTQVADLLLYYPRAYEFHTHQESLASLDLREINSIELEILATSSMRSPKTFKTIYKAQMQDKEGNICEGVWFNRPYQLQNIPQGAKRIITGKAKYEYGKISFLSPQIDYPDERKSSLPIMPIYPQTDLISSNYLLGKIKPLIYLTSYFPEDLPESVRIAENLMSRAEALKNIHFPQSEEILKQAKERLAFTELWTIQLGALDRKKTWQESTSLAERIIPNHLEDLKTFLASLPFTPTNAQKIAIWEILQDLAKPVPMQRMLEGDVGSGKTLVAAAVALPVVLTQKQVAFLAPTEILARQHYLALHKLYGNWQENKVKLALLLGGMSKKEKNTILADLKNGEIQVIIGTHALLQEGVEFQDLGLAIIDEQHRFGVEQRQILADAGAPHILNMTATPIPRSLALVAYGDHDLSVLNELPPGRKAIQTRVVPPNQREMIYRFMDGEIQKGRQIYVVCPLIQDSDSEMMQEVKSVEQEYQNLQAIFPQWKIAALHGKLSGEEKDFIMTQFKSNQINILVSTSVIEVGVDVPNANIMLIEGAERFGLAQLHQFRGRVGRGEFQSYCFLFTAKAEKNESQRLQAMAKYNDGFRLAEIDLELRGAGEIYGIRQSGIPDLKMANLADQKFVKRVRLAAEMYLFGKFPKPTL